MDDPYGWASERGVLSEKSVVGCVLRTINPVEWRARTPALPYDLRAGQRPMDD
jgi:hypothetical protein